MKIHRLYEDANGISHFEDVDIEYIETTPASDGEARTIAAGEVVLVEDTTGKGHLSKAINDRLRHCIFVTLD